MNQMLYAIALFAISIVCLALGNTLLKIGMDHFGSKTAAGASFFPALLRSPQLPLGVVLMIVQFVGTLILFKWGWDVSVVIPVMGLSYVATAILGKFMLGEPVHAVRWVGILLIIAGVMCVVQSAKS